MREQLQAACVERERLLSEKSKSDLENTLLEEVQSSLSSVSEEREQLLEILKANREEKNQLRRDLEEKEDAVSHFSPPIRGSFPLKDSSLKNKNLSSILLLFQICMTFYFAET